MAVIWRTDQPYPTSEALQEQIYNGLDSCVTLEVLHEIAPQLDEITGATYAFAKQLQAPILEMMLRGVRVDMEAVHQVQRELIKRHDYVQEGLDILCHKGLGLPYKRYKDSSGTWHEHPINPGSWQDKRYLFYEVFALPPVKKKGKITTDRGALEKLSTYFQAEPFCNHIMLLQDFRKKLGFLKTGIGSDGRIRTSFSISGTTTGRLASGSSAFWDGTNLQNITPEMRRIFIAD